MDRRDFDLDRERDFGIDFGVDFFRLSRLSRSFSFS
jgi:hypothetical protein